MADDVDRITEEVVLSAFLSIAEEMSSSLIRSAYSTNIKERRDCSCALFDPKGGLIALAENIPIHLGSMQGLMETIGKKTEAWNFQKGDIVIANDPFLGGGSHLPDVTLLRPVFYEKKLCAFAANIAHWTDIGGRGPGVGTAGDSTEIYQEGLRIPPIRLAEKEHLRQDVVDLMLANMRDREEREGDLRAQIAAVKLGERRLIELISEYGMERIDKVIKKIYEYSRTWMRKAIQDIPAGIYKFTDKMDDDGISDDPLTVRVAIEITHAPEPEISFDFTGTAEQGAGGINMVWQALLATVLYAVKAVIAPGVPINAGFRDMITIHAPSGTLVNAEAPAAVGGRTDTAQRVVDVILGALSEAVPEKVMAASNGATTAVILGGTKKTSGRDFIYVEALGGGMGARPRKDGQDGVQVHITNTSNLPVEAMEMEYPLRVLRYQLVTDSGGAGKYRGGMAIRKDIQALKPVMFSAHADRHRIPPWGLKGGKPGGCGKFRILSEGKEKTALKSKVSDICIRENEILSAQTAGGGGWGPPEERDKDRIQQDVRTGKISRCQAEDVYGLSLESGKKP
jgi:N-methylhydantoinase B